MQCFGRQFWFPKLAALMLCGVGLVLAGCHSGARRVSLDARDRRPPTDPAGHARSLALGRPPALAEAGPADAGPVGTLPWYAARKDTSLAVTAPIDPGILRRTTITYDHTAVSNGHVFTHYGRTDILVRQRGPVRYR